MSTTKKAYASMQSPMIEAAVNKFFSFATKEQALSKIIYFRENFIISNNQESKDSVILWVKGFMIEGGERGKGYTGNYAKLTIQLLPNDRWTIQVDKLVRDVSTHPQKNRNVGTRNLPDWGHFVLRAVEKKKVFATLEEAEEQLKLLHEEFPDSTIPAKHRLFTFIYRKPKKGESAAVKYILVIKACKEGGFIIEAKRNTYNKAAVKTAPVYKPEKPAKETKGYFTAKEELRK